MVVGDAIADGVFGSTLMSADGAGTAWPPLLCANVTLLEKQQRQRRRMRTFQFTLLTRGEIATLRE
jgi:hypothetical protein